MRTRTLLFATVMLIVAVILAACGQAAAPAAQPAAPAAKATEAPKAAAAAPTTAPVAAAKATEPAKAAAPAAAAPQQLPRTETLYMAGFQWQAPKTFNPLNSAPDWPASGNHLLIYETLFAFNLLTGNIDPLLAKDVKFTDQTTAVVTLQDGTKWSDGKPLTTDDVIYTYGLAKTQSDINYATLFNYISDIKATGDRTLEIKLNPQQINQNMVRDFLANIKILPKHIWADREKAGKLSQVVDFEPVGSGVFKVLNYSPERIALVRDDNYWGKALYGMPAPKYIVHPIFKSNNDGNLALQNAQVDVMQQFTPQIWKMWEEAKSPVGTWFDTEPYYVPGSIPMLVINVQRKGLDNPLVRRALAHSINYPLIAQTAMSKYSIPANPSLILPEGGEKKFFSAEATAANGWKYDPAKAKDILENQLKATKGADGIYVLPDGTRLGPWTARTPQGWTDWQTAIEVVVQSAKQAGIELKADFPDAPVVTSKIQNGDFDLNLWYIAASRPASPWLRFRDMLDDRGVAPAGQTTFWNYGRFKDPNVAAILDKAGAATDEAAAKAAYSELDKIFRDNIPGIPLMYRPNEFYEFNTTWWTGFPTAKNPTAPPMFAGAGVSLLRQIKPSGKQ